MAGFCRATEWFEKIFALFVITLDCWQSKKLKAHVSFSGTPRMEIKPRRCVKGGVFYGDFHKDQFDLLRIRAGIKEIASAENQNKAKTYEPLPLIFWGLTKVSLAWIIPLNTIKTFCACGNKNLHRNESLAAGTVPQKTKKKHKKRGENAEKIKKRWWVCG